MESPGEGQGRDHLHPLPIKNKGESLGGLELWRGFTFFPLLAKGPGGWRQKSSLAVFTAQRRDDTGQPNIPSRARLPPEMSATELIKQGAI